MNASERAFTFDSLSSIWRDKFKKLKRSCYGVDRVSAEKFELNRFREIREIRSRVNEDRQPFKSDGLLAIAKKKPNSDKYRIICVPTMADRLIQFALLRALKTRLKAMRLDNPISFGIAEGDERGVNGARRFACNARDRHPWVYKTDIQQFFDNIDRQELAEKIDQTVRQTSLTKFLKVFANTEISEGFDRNWRSIASGNGIIKGRGVRQGMPLSPLMAGIYLRDFDRTIAKSKIPVARYVDDIVAFFDTEGDARDFHKRVSDTLASIGLSLGDIDAIGSKTQIIAPSDPAPFLGMELSRSPLGKYRLQVSTDCITDCVNRIRDAGSIEFLNERRVHLTSMGQYFRSIVNGYIHAYAEARNCDSLKSGVEHASQLAQAQIMRELFGKNRLESLSPTQFEFLGIARETIFPMASRHK